MPDAPDSFRYSHITTLIPSQDINELAAKLNSPSTNFREGQIIYQNDFKDGLKGLSTVVSTGISTAYITTNPSTLTGNTLVITNTDTDESYAGFAKTTPVYDTRYYIFSYLFTTQTRYANVFLENDTIQNGYGYYHWLKLDLQNDKLYIRNSSGSWEEVPISVKIGGNSDTNIRIILKIDISTGYYVSIVINDTTIDLSSYAIQKIATSSQDLLTVAVYAGARTASAISLYFNAFAVSCSDN